MQHVIRKQTITLYLSGTTRAAAFHLQQELSKHYWQEILPEIEKVFDAASTENEVICIDRLEIDLGKVTSQELTGQRLPAPLLDSIRRQLRAGIAAAVASGKVEPVAVNIYGHWLSYMQKGYVPWNTVKITEEWYSKVLEALATEVESVRMLVSLLRSDPIVRYRIIQQHSTDFLIRLAGILIPDGLADLPAMIRELTTLLERLLARGVRLAGITQGRVTIHAIIWDEILKAIARHESGLSSQRLARIILEQVVPSGERRKLLQSIPSEVAILEPVVRAWKQEGFVDVEKEAGTTIGEGVEASLPEDDRPGLKDDVIFVQAAGVILLHPFLSQFFSRLQLVEAGAFTDRSARQKALYLVHYLATANVRAEEHELVMPKLLCGYPFHVPVDADVHITQTETDEADHLLDEVIHQWDVLKSTTREGLREGFLRRPGKLSTKNGHWRLQVESNAIDVLLDQLPWNLNLIKLPWMKEMLMVEWR